MTAPDPEDLSDLREAQRLAGGALEHAEKALPHAHDWARHALLEVVSNLRFAERRCKSLLAVLDRP